MSGFMRDAIWLKLAHKDGLSAAEIVDRYAGEPKPTVAEVVEGIKRALQRHKTVH